MYKLKTKKSVTKRFKRVGSGMLKFYSAKRRHNLTTRSSRSHRQSRRSRYLSKGDAVIINRFL